MKIFTTRGVIASGQALEAGSVYDVSEKDAQVIAQYLWEEGFIKKEEFPVEILRIED